MLLHGPQKQMKAGKLAKAGAGMIFPLIFRQPLVGLAGAPSRSRRSCKEALSTDLLQGLRLCPQVPVVRGHVIVQIRRPSLAKKTFLDGCQSGA